MGTFGWRVVAIGAVLLAVSLGLGAGEDDARRVSTKGGFAGPDEHQVPTEWGQPVAIASSAGRTSAYSASFRAMSDPPRQPLIRFRAVPCGLVV